MHFMSHPGAAHNVPAFWETLIYCIYLLQDLHEGDAFPSLSGVHTSPNKLNVKKRKINCINKFVDTVLLHMLTKPHFNLLLCLFGPTRENHPLQLETSWTVAAEPFPQWIFFFFFQMPFLDVSGRDMDTIVQRVNALSIASATLNKKHWLFFGLWNC